MTRSHIIGQSLVSWGNPGVKCGKMNVIISILSKDEVTVADLMRHEAGLAAFDTR